jgi:radical SAM enzyme (TIGR01210 family)
MTNFALRMIGQMGVAIKRDRERFWDTHDYFIRQGRRQGLNEALIFFRTRGCRHDAKGGCTMCDYSAGPPTTAKHMVDSVERALAELSSDIDSVLVSPSGSLLDSWEVPRRAREGIFDLLARSPISRIAFETRAETLDSDVVAKCREALGGKHIRVYVGLESSDPWVSTYAINKDLDLACFRRAMSTLHGHSMTGVANVLLGAPFLDEREALEDTETTVRWALANGAEEVCLFPCHVKLWTQVHLLFQHGLYKPPSLWSMVEVLSRLGKSVGPRIELAWLTSLDAFNVVASPEVCAQCHGKLIGGLNAFATSGRWTDLDGLWDMECQCRGDWRLSIGSTVDPAARVERAVAAFQKIGETSMQNWWSWHGSQVVASLRDGVTFHKTSIAESALRMVDAPAPADKQTSSGHAVC